MSNIDIWPDRNIYLHITFSIQHLQLQSVYLGLDVVDIYLLRREYSNTIKLNSALD